ncbi:MAG TPA: hypothetical protein VJP84_14700 [Steroidobacteraceae bacterium]|jgi:hypothetical protein|nr:hypothetical protein [Steroidobacteraceae bacterium]
MKNFLAVIAGLAVVRGIIGTVIGLAGLLVAWMASPQLSPLWYPALLVVTAIPCTWLGGRLATPSRG